MRQLTLRVPDELLENLKAVAFERKQSVNAFAQACLSAAIDPELAGSEAESLRERLARAGLLASGQRTHGQRPQGARLAQARAAAGAGRRLSDLVNEGRR